MKLRHLIAIQDSLNSHIKQLNSSILKLNVEVDRQQLHLAKGMKQDCLAAKVEIKKAIAEEMMRVADNFSTIEKDKLA